MYRKLVSAASVIAAAALYIASPAVAAAAETLPPPTITSPADLSLVPLGADISIAGSEASAGATVTVRLSTGAVLCAAVAEPDGSWACAPLPAGSLPVGHHRVQVEQEDTVGDTSPLSGLSTFSYGYDPVVISAPSDGEVVSQRPTVVGTATANTRISVAWVGQPFAEQILTDTGPDGSFMVTLDADVPVGMQALRVSEFLSGGVGGSRTVSSSVDVVIESAVTPIDVLTPADGAVVDPGFNFTGVGEPGAEVSLSEKGSADHQIFYVGEDGTFDVPTNPRLEPRTYTFLFVQSDDGSTDEVTVTVRGAPVITPVEISTPSAGAKTDPRPALTGLGMPGATITISDGEAALGSTIVASDGTWAFVPSSALSAGPHVLTATQDLDSSTDEVALTVVVPVGPTPEAGQNGGSLAATGADSTGLIVAAATLLVAGGVTALAASMKRRALRLREVSRQS